MDRNGTLDFIDVITLFSVFLQIVTYEQNIQQATNDDVMRELQKQDQEYFEKILENQKLILKKLAILG